MNQLNWEPYDPTWLVQLVKTKLPEASSVSSALSNVKQAAWQSQSYLCFIEREKAAEGPGWEFGYNLMLNHFEKGDLVLDILKNGEIAGIEFLNRV